MAYTGITQGVYTVIDLQPKGQLINFSIAMDKHLMQDLKIGASINLDGVCHSVVSITDQVVSFESGPETLALTTFNDLYIGRKLSIERSHKSGAENGGHEMYGHVIGTATICNMVSHASCLQLRLRCNPDWMKYILYKGFISVDGSSLTVGNRSDTGEFDINLIPQTLRLTNFAKLKINSRVNIEIDSKTFAIVETVERIMQNRS